MEPTGTGTAPERGENIESSAHQSNENRGGERRGGRNRHRGGNRGGQQSQQPPQSGARSSLNMIELREIAELIAEHGFTDFEFENENIRVRLRKELQPQFVQAAPMPSQAVQSHQAVPMQSAHSAQTPASAEASAVSNASAPSLNAGAANAADEDANLRKIVSPIVGTFYRSPSPEADAFVKVGSQVTAETIVCIVEAMKLMNEIPAETSGEIIKIYVENGQPVEYGQPLFAVK